MLRARDAVSFVSAVGRSLAAGCTVDSATVSFATVMGRYVVADVVVYFAVFPRGRVDLVWYLLGREASSSWLECLGIDRGKD